MRITKVYTKKGDAGQTRLAGGQQVWKNSLRVEVYGTIDELNAAIGLVRVFTRECIQDYPPLTRLEEESRWIQNKLFDMGGILSTAPGQKLNRMPLVSDDDVLRLERCMDECQQALAPLTEFVLPGGGKVSSFLHQARTICRRAERRCVELARKESVEPAIIRFLNRLIDTLFVFARWVNLICKEPDFLWERDT